ncbi:filamentous hemagglutinin N-terminal domain-containing protein, partial [Pandoraea pneumonica]|uniref:filamentous hemagglutinin N-terminal domain-containing protein n=1 Tax=Pandoraea pneumonica TaxID=2508299 RepID=UPI003CFA32C1
MLSATGSVYLLNPNGVVIGKSGVVNTGGNFLASTGRISNEEFLAGGTLNIGNMSSAKVVSQTVRLRESIAMMRDLRRL